MDFDNPTPVDKGRGITLPTRIISLQSEVTNKLHDNDYKLENIPEAEREQYTKLLESARIEGENSKRFWNMLVTTVAKAGYNPTDRPKY